jgi:DNA modification methylase
VREEIIHDARLILGDCREILPTLGRVDAVVTDPPYGIGMDGGNVGYKGFNDFAKLDWDRAPPDDVVSGIAEMGVPYIIWGGNYFKLPPARCYLVWDKGAGFKGRTYAESELALTNLDQNARTLTYDPLARGDYKGKSHPTQKPLVLMKWCLQQLPSDVKLICDPFMGSGSTGCAAVMLGKSFIGIEREPSYFEIACRRIEAAYRQPDLFISKPAPAKQEALEI